MAEARDLGQRWFDAVGSGDAAALEALLTPDCDFLTPGGPVASPGEAARYISAFSAAFPDAEFVVRRWIEEGSTAVAEGVYRGTHTEALTSPQGEIPATGNRIEVPFATVFEARDGRLSAHRGYWDNATLMGQLGILPQPPA